MYLCLYNKKNVGKTTLNYTVIVAARFLWTLKLQCSQIQWTFGIRLSFIIFSLTLGSKVCEVLGWPHLMYPIMYRRNGYRQQKVFTYTHGRVMIVLSLEKISTYP